MTDPQETAAEPAGASKNRAATWLQAAVGIAIIVVILRNIELRTLGTLLLKARLDVLILAELLFFAQLMLSAANLRFLLREEQVFPYRRMFTYYCFSWTAGLVSFGKLGEFSISYHLKREGIPYSKSLAIVLLDKVVTLAVFVLVAIVGTLWFFGFSNPTLLAFDALILAGLTGMLWFLTSARPPGASLIARVPKLAALLERRRENFTTFRQTFAQYFRARTAALFENLAGTAVKLLLMSINGSLLFVAIHSSINPLYMMFIITIAAIVALIPITLSGLGVVQATYIYLASLVNIPAEAAIATELLTLALNYALALGIAVVWLRFRPR